MLFVWLSLLPSLCVANGVPPGKQFPPFSWDTLPVFHHGSNQSGIYSDEAIETLAKFPMVVIEKWQDIRGSDNKTEDERIMFEGRRIKAMNPNVSVIFYYNAVCDFQQYAQGPKFLQHPEYWLRDSAGAPVNMSCAGFKNLGPAPDFSVKGARDLFIASCADAAKTGAVDGCFVDRYLTNVSSKLSAQTQVSYWAGKRLMLQELQAAVPGPVASNHMCNDPPSSYVDGVYGCEVETLQNSEKQVTNLQEAGRRGVVVEAVAKKCTNTKVDVADLATFLLGAGKYAYLACVNGWDKDGSHGVRWYPEFDHPLGEPEGEAVKGADGAWTRRFKSGTIASAHFGKKKFSVQWAKRSHEGKMTLV